MTDKKFEYCMYDGFMKDGEYLDNIEVQDLLNRFYEDNVRLKKTNQRLFDDLQKTTSLKSLEISEVSILMRENRELKKENKELKDTIKAVIQVLDEMDLFSEEALEHNTVAYTEMGQFDNIDAYDIARNTKTAIRMLKELSE